MDGLEIHPTKMRVEEAKKAGPYIVQGRDAHSIAHAMFFLN